MGKQQKYRPLDDLKAKDARQEKSLNYACFSAHSNKICNREDFYLCRVNKKSCDKNDLLLKPYQSL